jgi:hypothetical protein
MIEQWKPIPGFTNYECSNTGRVRGIKRVKIDTVGRRRVFPSIIIKPIVNHNGYHLVNLYSPNISSQRVHRLIALAFMPNPNNHSQVNHINGIKSDNRVENLEWCTPSENVIHAVKHGLKRGVKGEKSNLSKLKESDVAEIRRSSRPQKELALQYSISISAISNIVNNKTWVI